MQLATRGDGTAKDNEDQDLACSDEGLSLIDADPSGQPFEPRLDIAGAHPRRPGKCVPNPDRVLKRKRDLNSNVPRGHGRDCAVRQAVKAVAPARC